MNTLVIGDSLAVLPRFAGRNLVRLAVTSPPYAIGKQYGSTSDDMTPEQWGDFAGTTAKLLYDALTPDGAVFFNIGTHVPKKREGRSIVPLDTIAIPRFWAAGFSLLNRIVWWFRGGMTCTGRLSGRYETILWLVKDPDNYIFNLDDVRVPVICPDPRNNPLGANPTDVWLFERVNNMTKKKLGIAHQCTFPPEMVRRVVRMASNRGDTVLDPFAGSCTTLAVASEEGRNSLGIEINPECEADARQRLGSNLVVLR